LITELFVVGRGPARGLVPSFVRLSSVRRPILDVVDDTIGNETEAHPAHRSRESRMSVSWPRNVPSIRSPSTRNTADR